jgi:hypothetical protein
VACEIICADNGRFIDAMRRNTNIISPLWSFLQDMKPRHEATVVNNSITGDSSSAIQNGAIFFSRLNIFLFNKMLPIMINFLNERVPNSIELLVNNLDLQPISELLYRFYALYNGDNEILEWLKRGKFYELLEEQMIPEKGTDLHMAVSQFIKGLFSLPFPDSFPRNQVLSPFLNPLWLNTLLKNVFSEFEDAEDVEIKGEMEQSSIVNGLQIISSILRASRDFDSDEEERFLGDTFVSCLIENFETFFDILKRGNYGIFLLTTGKVEVFGRIRLEIVKMISEILICLPLTKNCESFVEKFKEIKIFPLLIDFFFHYNQNNLLHELLVEIIKEVFTEDYEKTPFNPLIDQIMKEHNLRQRIIDAQRENDSQVQKPRGNRLAFMGHLTLISEIVINWETNSLEVTKSGSFIISPVPEESWREYTTKTFRETRLKDKKVLGGIKPPISMHEMISSSEDSGDELLNYNSIFRSGDEEQMARYFCQQLIGNFPDQFLYADESEESEDSDDDMEIIFAGEVVNRSKSKSSKNRNVKSIEIPILMPHDDDFDEEMFDDSFTSSLLSDSESGEGHDDSSDNDDDEDEEKDYEM